MHHPDISNIMLIIEDYFILVDDNDPSYSIQPLIHNSQNGCIKLGINMSRQLLNGYIHAEIFGEGKDDDTITFKYYPGANKDKPSKCIEISDNTYSESTARAAIRTIMKLDKISTTEQVTCN